MKNTYRTTALLLVVTLMITPFMVSAQSSAVQYQPQTTRELIAYLYGRISQLQEIQQMLQENGGSGGNTDSLFEYVRISTQRADQVEETTAVLRGEAFIFGDAWAQVWFEYGEDEDFLDFRTSRKTVRSAYDRAVRINVSRLEPDERYYFRMVAEDNNDVITYGEIFEFRTDEPDDE